MVADGGVPGLRQRVRRRGDPPGGGRDRLEAGEAGCGAGLRRCHTAVMRRLTIAMLVVSAALAAAEPAGAAYSLDPIGTFSRPIFVTSEPDDPDRLLVVEQNGTIKLVDHGAISTFLQLPAWIAEYGW